MPAFHIHAPSMHCLMNFWNAESKMLHPAKYCLVWMPPFALFPSPLTLSVTMATHLLREPYLITRMHYARQRNTQMLKSTEEAKIGALISSSPQNPRNNLDTVSNHYVHLGSRCAKHCFNRFGRCDCEHTWKNAFTRGFLLKFSTKTLAKY